MEMKIVQSTCAAGHGQPRPAGRPLRASHKRRPYWNFERTGSRRFGVAAPVYRRFRVHG